MIMAKLEVNTAILDDYVARLETLKDGRGIGKSVDEGAKVVTDAIKKNIRSIPISFEWGSPENPIDGITPYQKKGLLDGFGIAKLEKQNGYWNVKCGFDGYNKAESITAKNAKWTTKQQPNALIARAVEKGTSFRKKHPFVAPAVRSSRNAAETAMKNKFDEELKNAGF